MAHSQHHRRPLSRLAILFTLAAGVVGCGARADPADLAQAQAFIGKTYMPYPAFVAGLCRTPELPVDCPVVSSKSVTILAVVPYGDTVFAGVQLGDGKKGYVLFDALTRNSMISADRDKKTIDKQFSKVLENLNAAAEFDKICTSNFSLFRIGMPESDARKITCAAGHCCADIHTTITQSGTYEQWVWGGGRYAYFTNGVLTAIQR